jgi:lysophospholipase L1-like esterase
MNRFNIAVFRSRRIVGGLLAVCFLLHAGSLQAQSVAPYLKNTNYVVQLGMYDLFASTHADVVMLGNSLTYNANWNEILNRTNIANRGIASDITSGYLHRLGYVYRLKPKLCFIEGGVNDLYSNDSVKNIVRNYAAIIDSLQSHGIVPVIQSTLFVAAKYPHAREKNKQVQTLNAWLIAYASKNGIEYLDINLLVSKDGVLRKELTYDGIHLNARGYALWAPEVGKVLAKYNL